MDYDMDIHIPNQIEALLTHRSNGDVSGFNYIIEGIKTMMNEHPELLSGLENDVLQRKQKIDTLFENSKITILNAFKDKNTVDGLNSIRNIILQTEQAYNTIELEYMNDVLTTLHSYDGDGVDD